MDHVWFVETQWPNNGGRWTRLNSANSRREARIIRDEWRAEYPKNRPFRVKQYKRVDK